MASSILNKLSAAKKSLSNANAFTKSAEGAPKSMFAPKMRPPKLDTPVAPKITPRPSFIHEQNEEASSLAAGLKAKQDNVNAAQKAGAFPKFHKGGKVKKTGLISAKKGETVRTKEQEKELQKKIKNTKPKNFLTSETKEVPMTAVSTTHNSMPVAYFVRHGETDMNKDNDFRGDLDVPLNEEGEEQAHQLVSYFHNVTPSAVYNSSRSRTAQTINPLAKEKGVKSKTISALDSLDTGDFAGQPKDDKNLEKMQWYREHPDAKIPGGDVVRDWQNRVDDALLKVIKESEKDGHPAIACVHGSVIKELSRFLHGDIQQAKVEPGGVVAIYKLPSGGYVAEPILNENDTDEDNFHPDS